MAETQLEMSEATNRLISSNTKCNSKQVVQKANERPEWLPDGWNVDFRIRKSGANMGCGYKCYIDPVNGYKFYSKPEVLRYLETIKGSSCTSKTEEKCNTTHSPNNVCISIEGRSCMTKTEERCNSTHSQSNVAVEKSPVKDLPPGWVKEVKVRKSGNGIKKDQFYTDPSNGYVFRSKKDVLRYLESGDVSNCATKPNKRHMNEDNFTPSSAGKRQKLKQSATKRQLFVGKELSEESSLAMPEQDVKLSYGMMVAPVPTSDSVVNMHSLDNVAADPPEMKKSADLDDVQEKNYIVDVAENPNGKNRSDPRVSKNKEFNVAPWIPRRLGGIEDDQLINKNNEQSVQVPKRNLRKSRTTVDADMANNSSEQLNGTLEDEHSLKMQGEGPNKNKKDSTDLAVFKEQPHQVKTENMAENKLEQNPCSLPRFRDSCLTSQKFDMKFITGAELPSPDTHNGHGLASDSLALKENKLHVNEIGKSGLHEIPTSSNKSRNKKEHHIPRRTSKRLAGVEPELVSNSISCEKALEYKSKKSKGEVNDLQHTNDGPTMALADHSSINGESSDKCRKPPEMTSITNNQLQQLEDEEMNEKSEPQLSFAFHYSWSDPSLDSAIKTLTGALSVEDSDGKGPIRIPENDMFHKNKLFVNGRESSGDKYTKVNSNKSKNKKEHKMPQRLSKRLAGHEPEVQPTERAIEYASRKSCKDKPTATAISTNGAAGHLGSKEETNLDLHASNSLQTGVPGASSIKHEKSYDAQTVPKEQVQKLEAENSDKERLEPRMSEEPYDVQTVPEEQLQKLEAETVDVERFEPQFPLPFGDSWSDPCVEFAIKTLTGALPVDAAADNLPVITTDVNDQPNKELLECVVQKSISEEAHDNSNQLQNKIEPSMVCQPSQQLLEQPELRTCSPSCKNDPKFANGESYSDEGNIKRNLDGGESLSIEAGNIIQLAHRSIDLNAQIFEGESVPAEQSQLETEAMNQDNSESQFCASFMDSWSDPYLDFAFKTLTGAIPVEENIAIQGCFQEPSNRHDQRDGSSKLPHAGSSSFAQSDFSFHNDIGEKSMAGQQPSASSTFLPPVKSSLHGSNVVDPQKHHSQCSHNFQRR